MGGGGLEALTTMTSILYSSIEEISFVQSFGFLVQRRGLVSFKDLLRKSCCLTEGVACFD